MNRPEPHELLDQQGEDKVVIKTVEKMSNTELFRVFKEDHTLGNVLRMALQEDPQVLFVGYSQPHPLEQFIEIKVQTKEVTTPREAMLKAIARLKNRIEGMKRNFGAEVERVGQVTSQWD